jgi:predicted nucleic acid-binding protein
MAKIINILRTSPRASDQVLVDTQVLLALTYPPTTLSPRDSWRFRPYISYLQRLRNVRGRAYVSVLAVAEMARFIERSEFELANGGQVFSRRAFKDWRNGSADARGRVSIALQSCVNSLEWYAELLPMPALATKELLTHFDATTLDPTDALLVVQATTQGISTFLTDDRDFGSVEGISVLTANPKLLPS